MNENDQEPGSTDPTSTEEAEFQAALDTLAGGVLPLVGALLAAVLSWWVDSWTLDLVLLLGSMALGVWAGVSGSRARKWLVVAQATAIVLLDLIVLVSAPL